MVRRRVVMQFDISRDIDGAARDVQAAINAAHADLPTSLRSNPTYNKFNPASFPIMILALTSKTLTPGQIYDQASNILQQKLSQITGVGDVSLAGAALPAHRVALARKEPNVPATRYTRGIRPGITPVGW